MPVDRRPRRTPVIDQLSDYVRRDTRLGRRADALAVSLRTRAVPLHWTNAFGVVTAACVVVLFVTGIFLMFFYTASSTTVTYSGSLLSLQGVKVSKAFDSTLRISLAVRGGLVVRQAHHWAALLLPASIILQLLTSFFTGAFRKPRQANWVLLFLVFVVALIGGWSGYALPDDMLSGSGLRIVEGIVLGIPVIGTWASALLFGGEFPGTIIEHLYPIHVILVPAALIAVLLVLASVAISQRPAQFPAPDRRDDNVVGVPVMPTAIGRFGGLLVIVMGVILLISALFTINPIWTYGPSAPGDANAGSQPDWYTGFLDGALRLVPTGWEFVWLGHTWTLFVIVPLAVVGLFMVLVLIYPFIEGWIVGGSEEHHVLQRPRDAPTRTAIGVAGMTFYGALWGAGSADVAAKHLGLSFEHVIAFYQVAFLAGPVVTFVIAKRVCLGLQRKDRELVLHGHESGRIVRLPGGEFVEVHKPLGADESWRIVHADRQEPVLLRPRDDGHLTVLMRARSRLSRFFFEDRIEIPATSEAITSEAHRSPSDETQKTSKGILS